jgi:hypothetical protein
MTDGPFLRIVHVDGRRAHREVEAVKHMRENRGDVLIPEGVTVAVGVAAERGEQLDPVQVPVYVGHDPAPHREHLPRDRDSR